MNTRRMSAIGQVCTVLRIVALLAWDEWLVRRAIRRGTS